MESSPGRPRTPGLPSRSGLCLSKSVQQGPQAGGSCFCPTDPMAPWATPPGPQGGLGYCGGG